MENNKKERKFVNIILAVLIAFGLWFYVINVENPTGSATLRDIPVTFQGEAGLTEAGLMITDVSDENMNLRLTGRKKTLMKLDRKNVTLAADVSTITQEGEFDLVCRTIFPSHINTDNVSVSSWDEMQVTITVTEKGSKTIPIRGEFIGTEAPGHLAGTVVTEPKTLELTGPETSLARIAYASVQVGGESVRDTIIQEAPVVFMDKNGVPVEDLAHITSSATELVVTVPVRQVENIPLTVSFREGDEAATQDVTYEITPKSITVVSEDAGELPDSISLGSIDLTQVYGKVSYSMPIHVPRGVTAWGTPSLASVVVSLENLERRQIATRNITLTNVPAGYQASLVSPKLFVWVFGPPSQVSKLTEDDLTVEVDLSAAAAGGALQRLPAQVALTGEGAGNVQVVGDHYSVALQLSR